MVIAPNQLSGLVSDFDSRFGVTTVLGGVSQWAEQSGNGYLATQTNGLARATVATSAINSQPALLFAGTSFLNATGPTMTAYTIFVVGQVASGVIGSFLAPLSWGGTSYTPDIYFSNSGGTLTAMLQYGTTQLSSGRSVGQTVPFVFDSRSDTTANTLRMRLNGRNGTTTPITNAAISVATGTTYLVGTDASSDQFLGYIARVLIYNRVLTDAETGQVEQYLSLLYGLPTGFFGDAGASATSTAAAAGSGRANLLAPVTGASTASATETGRAALSGATAATSTAGSSLMGVASLTGPSSGASSAAAALTAAALLQGTSSATSAANAAGSGIASIVGPSAALTASEGALRGVAGLVGPSASSSSASAQGTGLAGLSGGSVAVSESATSGSGVAFLSAPSSAASTAAGQTTGTANLSGLSDSASVVGASLGGLASIAGVSSASSASEATGSGSAGLSGQSAGSSAAGASESAVASLTGASSAVSSAAASGGGLGFLTGGSNSTSMAAAGFAGGTDAMLSGPAMAASSAGAAMTGAARITGASQASSATSATASAIGRLAGGSISTSQASATLTAFDPIASLSGGAVASSRASAAMSFTGMATILPDVLAVTDDDIGGYFRYATDLAPPWLSQPFGLAYLQSHGLGRDAMTEAYKDAVLVRLVKVCPPDALPLIGRDRGLPRYPHESGLTYRRRIAGAWRSYKRAGTKGGVVSALRDAGVEAIVYEPWETNADPAFEDWYWYHVLVPAPGITLGDGTWDSPGTWDEAGGWDDSGGDIIATVRAVCSKWAPAHSKLATITLILGGGTWDDPPGLWQNETGTWNDSTTIQWVNYAAYTNG